MSQKAARTAASPTAENKAGPHSGQLSGNMALSAAVQATDSTAMAPIIGAMPPGDERGGGDGIGVEPRQVPRVRDECAAEHRGIHLHHDEVHDEHAGVVGQQGAFLPQRRENERRECEGAQGGRRQLPAAAVSELPRHGGRNGFHGRGVSGEW